MATDCPDAAPAFWPALRARTAARIGLGRVGASLPTARQLDFQLAHARARDAVHAALDGDAVLASLATAGLRAVRCRSRAEDRATYLRRPDLGRRLDPGSVAALGALPRPNPLAFVIADGLSAAAVNAQAASLATQVAAALGELAAPAVLVHQGRVAVGDEVGALLGAAAIVVLIGERPGLSAADSMGAYVTWAPHLGMDDAGRNCVSNIRPGGLGLPEAAAAIVAIIRAARRYGVTGVALAGHVQALPPSGGHVLPELGAGAAG